jgi:phospholipid/cholesterol/gamma-HCH transport system permease protein
VGLGAAEKITALPDRVGAATLNGLAYVGGLARLTGESAYVTIVGPFRGQRLRIQRSLHQAMAVGVGAIPIVSLITFFVGLIMALQSAYELRRLGAIQFVADAVAISIIRELGPLITAIIVIGRSGSAFAAEIGTMKVTEEVDLRATRDALVVSDILTGLVKSALFAMVITAVGCQEGFSTGAGAEEVGRSTTTAVVRSIFLVIAVDLVFTALFYLTNRA